MLQTKYLLGAQDLLLLLSNRDSFVRLKKEPLYKKV